MKNYKHGKRVLSAALALALVFSMSIFAMADEITTGDQPFVKLTPDGFVFSDPTDLWDSFKNMMPGDEMSQEILVYSDKSGRHDFYLYARDCVQYGVGPDGIHVEESDPDWFNDKTIFDYLTITITDAEGNELNLTEAGEKTKGVALGRLRRGEQYGVTLTVTVKVDTAMPNEFQSAEGYIDWVFFAKQYVEPEDDEYTVTVNYYDIDGNVIHAPYSEIHSEGTRYDVTEQAFETITIGDTVYVLTEQDGDDLTGTMNKDKVINLYYEAPEAPPAPIEPIDPPVPPLDPVVPPITDIPETGDNGLILPAVMMVVSGTALAALLLFAPRKEREAE